MGAAPISHSCCCAQESKDDVLPKRCSVQLVDAAASADDIPIDDMPAGAADAETQGMTTMKASDGRPGETTPSTARSLSGESTKAEDDVGERSAEGGAETGAGGGRHEVVLRKQTASQSFGIKVDYADGVVMQVLRASGGLVDAYNASAPAPRRLLPGDFIVAVNGLAGDSQRMVEAMQGELTVRLVVASPVDVEVSLEEGPLGAELLHNVEGSTLVIAGLSGGGAIERHNRFASGEAKVRAFDRIHAVNGREGSPEVLLGELRKQGRRRVLLSRPTA